MNTLDELIKDYMSIKSMRNENISRTQLFFKKRVVHMRTQLARLDEWLINNAASKEFERACNHRNLILTDMETCLMIIDNMRKNRPSHGYADNDLDSGKRNGYYLNNGSAISI